MSMTADDPIAVELIAVGRTVPRRDYGVLRRLGRRVLARMGAPKAIFPTVRAWSW